MIDRFKIAFPIWLLICGGFLAGCQSPQGEIEARKAVRTDLSGSWEMDYSLNDSVEGKLDAYFYRMRRTLSRQSDGRQLERGSMPSIHPGTAQTVIAMAQFVERISRVQVMDIEQTYTDIRVDREGTFSLDCDFPSQGLEQTDNPFATEVCGWDGHQLVFQLRLPEGLLVQQRFSLAASGDQINVATTMMSDRAPEPFTLNRSYSRFDKRSRGYTCEQTVSKGKVCTLTSQPEERPAAPDAPKPIIMNAD
ncbi:hypothetical protein [Pseudomaricurvus sp.]|uniref:hypothetical protein n=1 Tax=Pseudomaricurvus sp. TaxID=2004510 RepID=UPI003F6AF16B